MSADVDGWLARLRVSARLARRAVRRTRRSSILVVAMIALPVAALAAGAIVAQSTIATPAQKADAELGASASYVRIVQGADPSLWQAADEPNWYEIERDAQTGEPVNTQGEMLSDPTSLLPTGTRMLPISDLHSVRTRTATGIGAVLVSVGDAWDQALEGRYEIASGTAPKAPGEVMATRAALERLGAGIGDTVELIEPAYTATITGILDSHAVPQAREIVFVPWADAAAFAIDPTTVRWYLPELALRWEPITQELNPKGVVAISRALVLDPPADSLGYQRFGPDPATIALLTVMGMGAAFAAYQVILLAGAAFAVSARRQRQALATAASVGAAPAELRRVVILQGTLLGLIGGIAGLSLGALAAWGVLAVFEASDRTAFAGYNVPWWLLALVLVFAVVVGTLAALLPARGAAGADVLSALRGARKPQQLRVSRPVWGSVLLVVGFGLAILGAVWAAINSQIDTRTLTANSPMRWLPFVAIVVGPILAQIGVMLAGAWLLYIISRMLARVGLGARLASRDAAANASRSVPAFASIAAAVFLSVFAGCMIGSAFAQLERNHLYQAPLGSAYGSVWAADPVERDVHADRLRDEFLQAGADDVGTVLRAATYNSSPETWKGPHPYVSFPESALCADTVDLDGCPIAIQRSYSNMHEIAIVAPEDLSTVLGVALPEQTLQAFAEGTVLSAIPQMVENGQIELGFWDLDEIWSDSESTGPSVFWQGREYAESWHVLPAEVIETKVDNYLVVLSPATAETLGIAWLPFDVIGSFREPPRARTLDAINQIGQSSGDAFFWVTIEDGPDQPWPWYLLVAGVAGVLVIGASAVSIGLARFDGRADDATLAAVGGGRGIRRSISFWQAIVITGVGTLCGVITGILPAWGVVHSTFGALRVEDFPWLLVVGITVGLPLAVAAGAWLLSPRPAVLTRRTAIT